MEFLLLVLEAEEVVTRRGVEDVEEDCWNQLVDGDFLAAPLVASEAIPAGAGLAIVDLTAEELEDEEDFFGWVVPSAPPTVASMVGIFPLRQEDRGAEGEAVAEEKEKEEEEKEEEKEDEATGVEVGQPLRPEDEAASSVGFSPLRREEEDGRGVEVGSPLRPFPSTKKREWLQRLKERRSRLLAKNEEEERW